MNLYERVKYLSEKKEIAISRLEQELGFGNGTIRKWAKTIPSGDRLQKVADFFHVSVDYLLGREEKSSSLELPPNIRAAARGLLNLSEEDRDLAINMINSLSRKGKEAKDS